MCFPPFFQRRKQDFKTRLKGNYAVQCVANLIRGMSLFTDVHFFIACLNLINVCPNE